MDRPGRGGRIAAGIAAVVILIGAITAVAVSWPSAPGTSTAASPTDPRPAAPATPAEPTATAVAPPSPSGGPEASASVEPSPSESADPLEPTSSPAPSPTTLGPWTVLGAADDVQMLWSPDGRHLLLLHGAVNGPADDQILTLLSADGAMVRTYLADDALWLDDQRFLLHHWQREDLGGGTWAEPATVDPERLIGVALIGEIGSDRLDEVGLPPHGLSSGHGALAYDERAGRGVDTRFRVWTADGWTEWRPGYPVDWSPRGDKLAVLHLVDDRAVTSRSLAALVGDPPSGIQHPEAGIPPAHGWLEVLEWPAMARIHSDRDLDLGSKLRFDPSGAFVASYDTVIELASGRVSTLASDDFGYDFAWDDSERLIFPSVDGDGIAYTTDGRVSEVWPNVGDSAFASADGSTVVFYWTDRDEALPLTILRDGTTRELDLPSVDGEIGDDGSDDAFKNCHDPRVSPDGSRVAIVCVVDGYTALLTEL